MRKLREPYEKAEGQTIVACDNVDCIVCTYIGLVIPFVCPGCQGNGRVIVVGPTAGMPRIGQADKPS